MVNWIDHRTFNLGYLRHNIIIKPVAARRPNHSVQPEKTPLVVSRTFLRQCIHDCTVNTHNMLQNKDY